MYNNEINIFYYFNGDKSLIISNRRHTRLKLHIYFIAINYLSSNTIKNLKKFSKQIK